MLNLRSFAVNQEEGQDLIEYTLLMALFALMASSIFLAAGLNTKSIWAVSNTQLAAASAVATGGRSALAGTPAAPPSTLTPGGAAGDSSTESDGRGGRHDDHHGSH